MATKVLPGPMPQPAGPPARPAPPLPRRGRRLRRWIVALFVLALAGAATVEWWRMSLAPVAVQYATAGVARGAITRTITASGSVNPVITIQVGTYVSGVIQELYCDYNTVVRKGQLCAKIDPRPYQVIVDQDRAAVSTANAQLAKDKTGSEYARLTYERTVSLRDRGIVSQDTLDSAKSAYDQAIAQVNLDQANVEQREAALNAAEINLAYTDIVSPVNGTVVSRNVTMGQTVAASFQTPTLFLIATDLTKMQVDANVSESDIGGIQVGHLATFTVETFPDRIFSGTVAQVRQAPQTVQNVVTYDVVISVPNQDLALKPGMTATARILVEGRENVLRVPNQAVRYAPGGVEAQNAGGAAAVSGPGARVRVWVLHDGRPLAVPVTLGLDDDVHTEIVSGALKEGDAVITSEQAGAARAASRTPMFRL